MDIAVPPVLRLKNVALQVRELEENLAWYRDVVGLFLVSHLDVAISDHVHWEPGGPLGLGFWRVGENHHEIAAFSTIGDGLHHLAFVVSGVGDLVAMADWHAARGFRNVENGIGRHGAGKSLFLYARDPPKNIVEFSTDLARINDRGAPYRVWERASESGNLWGPIDPPRQRR